MPDHEFALTCEGGDLVIDGGNSCYTEELGVLRATELEDAARRQLRGVIGVLQRMACTGR